MTKSVKKLSGPSLNRFFKRFYRAQAGLDPGVADRLAEVSAKTFSSVRIRRIAWSQMRNPPRRAKPPEASPPAPLIDDRPSPTPPPATPAPPFDPYSFGLVPVYQREGRDGLLGKLATVETPEHLRKMARAQQIALPAELRTGDIDLAELREAITAAVEKRIANRRAAAG